jgi:hypothetical protein
MPASEELWTAGVGGVADEFASVLRVGQKSVELGLGGQRDNCCHAARPPPRLAWDPEPQHTGGTALGRVRWLMSTEDRD